MLREGKPEEDMSIYVVSHKPTDSPNDLPGCYRRLYVGPNKDSFDYSSGAFRDDDGDNIAHLNSSFCELTGMYWIWKNRHDDIKGLCHYRRFFSGSSLSKDPARILGENEIADLLSKHDCIVPLKSFTNMPVNVRYQLGHSVEDWEQLRAAVADVSPEYLDAFEAVTSSGYFYAGNMLIARSEAFDSYCEWLFPVLFNVMRRIDLTDRDAYQSRAIGFMSERLFRVWLECNSVSFVESPVLSLHSKLRSRVRVTLDNQLGKPVPRLFDKMTKKLKKEGLPGSRQDEHNATDEMRHGAIVERQSGETAR